MKVSFEVPEEVAALWGDGQPGLGRAALEAFAAEGYRCGQLSESQVRQLLEMTSRFEVHDWLRDRRIPYRYTEADLESDLATLSELGIR